MIIIFIEEEEVHFLLGLKMMWVRDLEFNILMHTMVPYGLNNLKYFLMVLLIFKYCNLTQKEEQDILVRYHSHSIT